MRGGLTVQLGVCQGAALAPYCLADSHRLPGRYGALCSLESEAHFGQAVPDGVSALSVSEAVPVPLPLVLSRVCATLCWHLCSGWPQARSNLGQGYQVAQDLGLCGWESWAVWLLMVLQKSHRGLQQVTGSAVLGGCP